MDSPAALRTKSKDELIALVVTGAAEVDKLHLLIKQLQRTLYGRRAERLDPDQLQLALEEVERSLGTAEAATEQAGEAAPRQQHRSSPPRRNRGALPKHLPREEVVIAPENRVCPCCGGALHVIGEDVSEQLDVIPAQFKVKVIRRPRYGCRACEGAVVQAPVPPRPIRRRPADRGHARPCLDRQIPRSPTALPSGADLRPPGHRARPVDLGQLGRAGRLVAGAAP